MLDIVQRNFFRLLRAGAFSTVEGIEPMSAWKWRQVFGMSQRLHVAPLLFDGVHACKGQFFMQLPDALYDDWQVMTERAEDHYEQASGDVAALMQLMGELQLRPILLEPWTTACLYPIPSHRHTTSVAIYFPYPTQGAKADEWAKEHTSHPSALVLRPTLQYHWQSLTIEHRHRIFSLNSKMSNKNLQSIVEKEWLEGGTSHIVINGQRIETVAPTLALLLSLLGFCKTTLDEGPSLWRIVDLGQFLRQQGHLVDFVKLQGWIERLGFVRLAQVAQSALISLLGFAPDEVPFTAQQEASSASRRASSAGSTASSAGSTASSDDLANELLGKRTRKSRKYMRYNPGESLSGVVASITHSLGNVEE